MKAENIQELIALTESKEILEKLKSLKPSDFEELASTLEATPALVQQVLVWQGHVLTYWTQFIFKQDSPQYLPGYYNLIEFAAIVARTGGESAVLKLFSQIEQNWSQDIEQRLIEIKLRSLERLVPHITAADPNVSSKLRVLIANAYQPSCFDRIHNYKAEACFRKILTEFYQHRELGDDTDLSPWLGSQYIQNKLGRKEYAYVRHYLPYLNTQTIDTLVWEKTSNGGNPRIDTYNVQDADVDFMIEICELAIGRNDEVPLSGLFSLLYCHGYHAISRNHQRAQRIYNFLKEHTDRFPKLESGKTHHIALIEASLDNIVKRVCDPQGQGVEHIHYLFDDINLDILETVLSKSDSDAYQNDKSLELILSTLDRLLEAKAIDGTLLNLPKTREYLYQAITNRLNLHGEANIDFAKRAYELLAKHHAKFCVNTKGQQVHHILLYQLANYVPNKLTRPEGQEVPKVAWYFGHITLDLLEAVIHKTNRDADAYRNDAPLKLILTTLERLLKASNARGILDLVNIRHYLFEAINNRVNRGGEANLAFAQRAYAVLATHAAKFGRVGEKQVHEFLQDQLIPLIANKLTRPEGQEVPKVVWYFEHITLDLLEAVIHKTNRDADTYCNDAPLELILTTLERLLEASTAKSTLNLASIQTYLFDAIKNRVDRGGEANLAFAQRAYAVLATHAAKFRRIGKDLEQVHKFLLGQLIPLIANKLTRPEGQEVPKVVWYFEHITLDLLEAVIHKTNRDSDTYCNDAPLELILTTLERLLEASTAKSTLNLASIQTYLFDAIKNRVDRGGEANLAFAQRAYSVLVTHAVKFGCIGENQAKVHEYFLNELIPLIANKLKSVEGKELPKVKWCFEYINLDLLDTVIEQTNGDSDTYRNKMPRELILNTLERLLVESTAVGTLDLVNMRRYLYSVIINRLDQGGEADIEFAKRAYGLLAEHHAKFSTTNNDSHVHVVLLYQLSHYVAQKIKSYDGKQVLKVAWYFDHVTLELLEYVIALTREDRDAFQNKQPRDLILKTLLRLLAVNENKALEMTSTRCYLKNVVKTQLGDAGQAGNDDFSLTNEVFKLLENRVFNDKQEPNAQLYCIEYGMIPNVYFDNILDYTKKIVDQISKQEIKDDLYRKMQQVRIRSLFRFTGLDSHAAVQDIDEFASSEVEKIKAARSLSPLESDDVKLIVSLAVKKFHHFSSLTLCNATTAEYQANNKAFFTPLMTYLTQEGLIHDEMLQEVLSDRSVVEHLQGALDRLFSDFNHKLRDQRVDEARNSMQRIEAILSGAIICVDGVNLKTPEPLLEGKADLEALVRRLEGHEPSPPPSPELTGIYRKPVGGSPEPSPRGHSESPKKGDLPVPRSTVSESFVYFDEMKTSYQTYLQHVSEDDPRHAIYKDFDAQYGAANTDQEKINAINSVLENQALVDALKQETHGERFVKALKIILSILTAGLAAIPFAIHSHYKYGSGLFGHNRGAVFLKQCERFVEIMNQEDDSREVPTY